MDSYGRVATAGMVPRYSWAMPWQALRSKERLMASGQYGSSARNSWKLDTNISKSEVPSNMGVARVKLAFSLEYYSNSTMRVLCSAMDEAK